MIFLVIGLAGLVHQPPDPETGAEPGGLVSLLFGWYSDCRPCPPEMPPEPVAYMEGLMATGYFWPLLKIVEIVCGALLISSLYVPLALVVLAPIVLHILLFQIPGAARARSRGIGAGTRHLSGVPPPLQLPRRVAAQRPSGLILLTSFA